ncbi:MAG: VOC family protein [Pseudomonadota bacterium]
MKRSFAEGNGELVSPESKPEEHGTVTPYFTVENADDLIRFLKTVFDAFVIKESRYPDNRVQHVRMRLGNSVIMMNEATEDYPVNVSQMHLMVEDCETVYELALRSGAMSVMKPNDRPHGERMAGIKDPCGNIWWLATRHQ